MRGRLAPIVVGVLAATLLGSLVAPARAASEPVPDPNAELTFLAGLPYDRAGLERAARQASSPGTPAFRRYLTVPEAAARFGASTNAEEGLARAARAAGLRVAVDGTRLFARITGTVAQWERAMGASVRFRAATAGSAQWSSQPPISVYRFVAGDVLASAPRALERAVTWFLPEYWEYVPSLDIPGVPPPERLTRTLIYPGLGGEAAPTNGGSPLGPSCVPAAEQPRMFTPSQLSTAYGLGRLQGGIDRAQPRIAVLSLGGGFSASDVAAAAACFGHRAPAVDVRLGPGIPSPIVSLSGESALDLQTVAWAARSLRSVRFVQVMNNTPAFIEAYSLALTGWATPPDAITNSWGECETAARGGNASLATVESLLQLAAVVGTSAFAASGDTGSSSCQAGGGDPAQARPTVQYPASSPSITAVGGTQLNLGPGNARVGESVWNDLQYGFRGNAVGSGGPSVVFDAPWYQRPISASQVRSVPDIAAQAGVAPGTAIYLGGEILGPAGGTSQASPLVATGFAMLSARLRAAGEAPLGFVNPWLYRLARTQPASFYDITVGDNQYPVEYAPGSLNIPACCQAFPGYDMASGIGAPLFDRLAGHAEVR
jgi:kumamolisin